MVLGCPALETDLGPGPCPNSPASPGSLLHSLKMAEKENEAEVSLSSVTTSISGWSIQWPDNRYIHSIFSLLADNESSGDVSPDTWGKIDKEN